MGRKDNAWGMLGWIADAWKSRGVQNFPHDIVENVNYNDLSASEKAEADDAMHDFVSADPNDPDYEEKKARLVRTMRRVTKRNSGEDDES